MIVGDIFERNAALYRAEPAIFFEQATLSHGELLEHAYRLGNALAEQHVHKQDRAMILAQNSIQILELNAACSITGIIGVTLNYRLSAVEQAHIIKDCAPSVLIYEAQYQRRIQELCEILGEIPLLVSIGPVATTNALDYDTLLAEAPASKPALRAKEEDILFLVYTSGTTGNPKGVMQSHGAQVAQAQITSNACAALPSDRLLAVMPYYHAGANNLYLAYAWSGATVVLHRNFDVNCVIASLVDNQISAALLAPVMIRMLLDALRARAPIKHTLRTIVYSSAPMPVPTLRQAIEYFGSIFNQAYGMTECMTGTFMYAHQHKLDGSEADRKRLASAGQPYFQTEITLRREDGSTCMPGEVGEIVIKSPTVMSGYWNSTSATLRVLREGWYSSGDMGYLDADNFLFVVDRKKDMIISGGENIYSREVEEALLTHPSVVEVAVVGVPDEKWGESVLAVVVCRGEPPCTIALIEHCRQQIASYKKPKFIEFIDALPRIPSTNKIDKKRLRTLYAKAAKQ